MKRRSWNVDHHGGDACPRIEEGDIVKTAGGKTWRVGFVRPVNSKVWPDRWHVEYVPWELGDEIPIGARVHELGPAYRRGERPGDQPCGHPNCEGCAA